MDFIIGMRLLQVNKFYVNNRISQIVSYRGLRNL